MGVAGHDPFEVGQAHHMNVIVVGCGRVGSQLATMLSVEGHNVVVIDKDESAFRRLGSTFNGVTLRGLGFDEEVLEEAGAREADAFAAVTDLDNTNLMACEVARKIFGIEHAVARLYNPVRERTYQQLDLDYVCGTTLVAESLVEKIKSGHGHHVTTIDDIEVVDFKAGSNVDGKRVADVEIEHTFRIFAITRSRASYVPDADMVLRTGDIIFGAVKEEAFPKIERLMGE
jgi:trk system potassium uptake protein TrkA